MKRLVKILGIIFGIITLLVAGLLTYVKTMLPSVGEPPEMRVEVNNDRIERGKYLANHVMLCMDCHSTRDWSLFSGPSIAGTEGKGGEVFDQKLGFPGKYVAGNITPYNLSKWTDGEIFRAITSGVSKDGRALFPIMPYLNYGKMDRNDIEAVIAYIRSIDPIKNETEESSSDFPMNFIINTIPQKAEFKEIPPESDVVKYGEYLVTGGGCMGCHTNEENLAFAGGSEFKYPDGTVVRSANLTPDKETGIGSWSKEQFINRFKMYADSSNKHISVKPGELQSPMAWTMYAGMTTDDLAAIYEYLQTVKPVKNTVIKFTKAE